MHARALQSRGGVKLREKRCSILSTRRCVLWITPIRTLSNTLASCAAITSAVAAANANAAVNVAAAAIDADAA